LLAFRGRVTVAVLLLAGSSALSAPASAQRTATVRPERIVLVTVDGLAAERAARDQMPVLAELIGRGASSPRALSPSSGPLPATASLLTGRLAPAESPGSGRAASPPTLAAALARRGYQGLALPAGPFVHARTEVAGGFARFGASSPGLADSARVDSALAWLARSGRRFAWLGLSFGETPKPWRWHDLPSVPDVATRDRRGREIDTAIGRLIAGLERSGLGRGTLLVVAGTHGLGGDTEPLRVPLAFVRLAERVPATLAGEPHLVDVAPTLVAAAGGTPSAFGGRDLLGGAGRARSLPRPVSTPALAPCRAALDSLIAHAGPQPDSVSTARLRSLAQRCPDDPRVGVEFADALSRTAREADGARVFLALRERWPEDHASALAYAQHLLRHGRFAMVAEALAAIPRTSPYSGLAEWLGVAALAGEVRFAEATRAAIEAAEVVVPTPEHLGMAATLGRLRDAQAAAESRKGEFAAHLEYGKLLGGHGIFEEAYKNLHQARFADTTSAEPDFWIATFVIRQGRLKQAQATLERALRTDPAHRRARALLAEVLVGLDRWKEAVPHLERVVAEDPGDAQSRYNLACLLARDGRPREALEALKLSVRAGYTNFAGMRSDPDLAPLRDLPEFQALLPAGR
jgi:thioredoxin-like negative regulator of GroEL